MWNIFESFWLLLTLAGISLVVVSIMRDAKPEWGYKPMLIPIVLAGLAFGLDAAVQTDYEAVKHLIATCKNAAVQKDFQTIADCLSPNYADGSHRNKAAMVGFMESAVSMAALEKIRTQAHTISEDNKSSELALVVHLENNSQYAVGGGMFFVSLKFDYEKIGKKTYIKQVNLVSVNNNPMNWGSVP